MACYGNASNGNSASRNGRRRGARPGAFPGRNAAAAAGATSSAAGRTGLNAAAELYGPEFRDGVTMRTCCDAYTGCHQFRSSLRSSFWPSFAHPRWMSCRDLYSGGRAD